MSATKWIVAVVAIVVVLGLGIVVYTNMDKDNKNNDDNNGGNETPTNPDPIGEEEELVTIYFDTMGGSSMNSMDVVKDSSFPMVAQPTLKGYEFYGWYKDKSCSDGQVFTVGSTVTTSIVLYAKWVVDESSGDWCQISFNTNGGTDVSPISVVKGNSISPGSPSKSNFEFGGWYTDSNLKNAWDSNSQITASMTLYAKWNDLGTNNYAPVAKEKYEWITTYVEKEDSAAAGAGNIYMVVSLGTIDNVILAEHTEPTLVNSSSQEITITNTAHTEETISKSLSRSISHTNSSSWSVEAGFSKVLSISTSYTRTSTHTTGETSMESQALTTARSMQNSTSYALDFISLGKYVIVCTIGSVEIYQIFILDPVTGKQSIAFAYNTWNCYNTVVSADSASVFDPVSAFVEQSDIDLSKVFAGKGIVDDEYAVTDAYTLLSCAFGPSSHYKLTEDVDLKDLAWAPLGKLKGSFDGMGHTIKNMAFYYTIVGGLNAEEVNIGLFSFIEKGGIVKNLNMSNSIVRCPTNHAGDKTLSAGIIAGGSQGTITSCNVTGSDVGINRGTSNLGGIVGRNASEISNCSVSNSVIIGYGNIGGLAGRSDNGTHINSTVSNCTMTHMTKDDRSTGGLVGYANTSTIKDCKTSNNVFKLSYKEYSQPRMGYLVGHLNGSTVTKTTDTGSSDNIASLIKSYPQIGMVYDSMIKYCFNGSFDKSYGRIQNSKIN